MFLSHVGVQRKSLFINIKSVVSTQWQMITFKGISSNNVTLERESLLNEK